MNRNRKATLAALLLLLAGAGVFGKAGDTPMLTVHNQGVGGQNSRPGKARFTKDVLSLTPDYVFIYFGLNDVLNESAFLAEKTLGRPVVRHIRRI